MLLHKRGNYRSRSTEFRSCFFLYCLFWGDESSSVSRHGLQILVQPIKSCAHSSQLRRRHSRSASTLLFLISFLSCLSFFVIMPVFSFISRITISVYCSSV